MGFISDYIKDGLSATFQLAPRKKEPSILKDLVNQPDNFIFEGQVVDGEIRIVIKRNEKITTLNE